MILEDSTEEIRTEAANFGTIFDHPSVKEQVYAAQRQIIHQTEVHFLRVLTTTWYCHF